jgi:hypothetical protein
MEKTSEIFIWSTTSLIKCRYPSKHKTHNGMDPNITNLKFFARHAASNLLCFDGYLHLIIVHAQRNGPKHY